MSFGIRIKASSDPAVNKLPLTDTEPWQVRRAVGREGLPLTDTGPWQVLRAVGREGLPLTDTGQ